MIYSRSKVRRVCFAVMLMTCLSNGLFGQQKNELKSSPDGSHSTASPGLPPLAFDVASIREAKDNDHSSWIENPLHASYYQGHRLTAQGLVVSAYHLQFAALIGGPSWIRTTRFDISAKSDQSADQILASLNNQDALVEKRNMLKKLLAERFALKVHEEERPGTIYKLVQAKGGSKLREVSSPNPPPGDGIGGCGPDAISREAQSLKGSHCLMPALVNRLTIIYGAPVVNETGLDKAYDFNLQWNRKTGMEADVEPSTTSSLPPLSTALREQLGLEVKPVKGLVKMTVIDDIKMPSPN